MAAPTVAANALRLGFRFEPTPRQVVTYYLPLLIAGKPMHAAISPYIHAANIYACAPGELAARFQPTPSKHDRFFFTSVERQKIKTGKGGRYVRVAGPGSWVFQKGDAVKDDAGVKVGEIRKLRYRIGGVNTDWLMEEYTCVVKGAVVGDKERVFCRIYVSPNANADSAARQESAAFLAPPLGHVVPAPAATRKRPAPLIVNPPCPKRIQVPATSPQPGTARPYQTGGMVPTVMHQSFSPQTHCSGMVPTLMQPGRSPATTQQSAFHINPPMIQPLIMQQPCPKRIQGAHISPIRLPISSRPGTPRPHQSGSMFPTLMQHSCSPQTQYGGMGPTLMQLGRSPAPTRPSTFHTTRTMIQSGRAPAIAPLQPSQQSRSSVPAVARAYYQMIPEAPQTAVPAPPVKQEQLAPPSASSDHSLPAVNDGFDDYIRHTKSSLPAREVDHIMPAEAEHDDLDVDLINSIESTLLAAEADDDTEQVVTPSDDVLGVNEQGHELLPPPPQKEARKFLDPFEAPYANEED